MSKSEAHGGYLCRLETLEGGDLPRLARESLEADGEPTEGAGLLVSVLRKVVRFAYDAPHTYGRRGAQWYGKHHALAARLSTAFGVTVHAYVFDPDELESVVTYGAGHRVGGETVRYEDAEIDDEEISEEAFEALRGRWPMAHLGRLLGLTREELIRLPYARSVLMPLDADAGPGLEQGQVEDAHRRGAQRRRHVAGGDAQGEALDDGGLADAGLAGEDRVVLPAAGEDVDDLADLRVAAEHRV